MNSKGSIFFYISLIYIISLFYAKAGLSISMLALLVLGIFQRWQDLGVALKGFFTDKVYLGLTLVFLVYVFSGFNSENLEEWLKQVRIKLPFLILPVAFYLLNNIIRNEHKWIHLFLGSVSLLSIVPVLLNFINNEKTLVEAIGKGQYIPTPIDHIHYSIIIAYASLSLILLLLDKSVVKKRWEKCIGVVVASLLCLALHILAVRSGIVIFYLGVILILSWYIITYQKYFRGGVGFLFLIMTPFLAYHLMPSLNKKVHYMIYDYKQFKKGEGKNYSDSERVMSYTIATELLKESPIFGHGVGDLKALMKKRHISKYGKKEKYIFPHNQYLYVLATTGIIGFLFFFYGLLSPLIYSVRNPYLLLIYMTILASFMVENTVQRAVSIAFFLFFILISVNNKKLTSL